MTTGVDGEILGMGIAAPEVVGGDTGGVNEELLWGKEAAPVVTTGVDDELLGTEKTIPEVGVGLTIDEELLGTEKAAPEVVGEGCAGLE